MLTRSVVPLGCLVASLIFGIASAGAQPIASPPWEIEIHAGALSGSQSTRGVAALPEERTPFVVLGESLPTSPSWFFGPAAGRLDQAFRFLGGFRSVDAVLTTASARRATGGDLGVKVSRRIAGRLRAEVTVDYSRGQLTVTREAQEAIEASRASFARLFGTLPFFSSADAISSIREQAGREIVTTASLGIDVMQRSRVVPFVTVGGGVISRLGDRPGITLRGEYTRGNAVSIPGVPPFGIAQSDTVDIHYAVADHAPVAVVGGGVRFALSPRWVARLDARGYFHKNSVDVTLDATPTTRATVPGTIGGSAVVFFGPSGPPIRFQFSTDPSVPQSLRGPAIEQAVTFDGSGVVSRFALTAGLGWRF